MPTEGGEREGSGHRPRPAPEDLLSELSNDIRVGALETIDDGVRLGLLLGLNDPQQARRLLELIDAREAERGAHIGEARGSGPDVGIRPAAVPEDPGHRGGVAFATPGSPALVPFRSRLLARSAVALATKGAREVAEPVFGWTATLTPVEIVRLGRVVADMLRTGAPSEIGRGFGIAWRAGVRLPRAEQGALFGEFVELEVAVAAVLAGHDLHASEPGRQRRGLGGLLLGFSRTRQSQADVVIEECGEDAHRGLVALWNAWMALRYGKRIPRSTLELLVRPWVTVVGPLPEP